MKIRVVRLRYLTLVMMGLIGGLLLVLGRSVSVAGMDHDVVEPGLPDKSSARSPVVSDEYRAARSTTDAYGYTWEATAFTWIPNVDLGMKLLPEPDAEPDAVYDDWVIGPQPIGFSFPFFEDHFSNIYVSTNGQLGFSDALDNPYTGAYFVNFPIPFSGPPFAFIAPMWDDHRIDGNLGVGALYSSSGTSSGKKYYVVEWNQFSKVGETASFTFQAILYEDGDIIFSYGVLSGTLTSASVGIEDWDGVTGLEIFYNEPGLTSNTSYRISRPKDPAFRAKAYPEYLGDLSNPKATYKVTVKNNGNNGPDTYNLLLVFDKPGWTGSIKDTEGTSAITQTLNILPGQTYVVTIEISPPPSAKIGADVMAKLHVRSAGSGNTQTAQVRLGSAVPAYFVSTYAENGIDVLFEAPFFSHRTQVNDQFTGSTFGLFNGVKDELFFVQENGGFSQEFWRIIEIRLVLLDPLGNLLTTPKKVVDHSLAENRIEDTFPHLSAAQNGEMGIVWLRREYDGLKQKHNILFARLDSNGNRIGSPIPLTQNTEFSEDSDLDVLRMASPQVVAFDENSFMTAWIEARTISETGQATVNRELFYTIISPSGGTTPRAKYTSPNVSAAAQYFTPSLANLNGNRVLLTFSTRELGADNFLLRYVRFNPLGNPDSAEWLLPGAGGISPDTVQLTNGDILIGYMNPNDEAAFALITSALNGVTKFSSPELATPNRHSGGNVSVTRDSAGNGIIMWQDDSFGYYLYYALVNGTLGLVTQPVAFAASSGERALQTSTLRAGVASYSPLSIYLPLIRR